MKVIQKLVLVASALVITSCSGTTSNNDNPAAPQQPGDQPTVQEQSTVNVKLNGEEWAAGSILAISTMGNVTLYFAKKSGVSCMDLAQSPSLNDTVQLLFPENAKSFENLDRNQMAKNGIAANFILNMMNLRSASQLSLVLEKIDASSVAATILATSDDGDSIRGSFDVSFCFKK